MTKIKDRIDKEMDTAFTKYGAFNSTHEVYGVLIEEVDEFFELVKIKADYKGVKNEVIIGQMISELTQIAAIAQRAIKELEANQIKWV